MGRAENLDGSPVERAPPETFAPSTTTYAGRWNSERTTADEWRVELRAYETGSTVMATRCIPARHPRVALLRSGGRFLTRACTRTRDWDTAPATFVPTYNGRFVFGVCLRSTQRVRAFAW